MEETSHKYIPVFFHDVFSKKYLRVLFQMNFTMSMGFLFSFVSSISLQENKVVFGIQVTSGLMLSFFFEAFFFFLPSHCEYFCLYFSSLCHFGVPHQIIQ